MLIFKSGEPFPHPEITAFCAKSWDILWVALGTIFEGSFLNFTPSLVPLLLWSVLHIYLMSMCVLQRLLLTPYIYPPGGANNMASDLRIQSFILGLFYEADVYHGGAPGYSLLWD